MASNPDLTALRNRAADLERRVGRKFSRIKSKTGAILTGTEYDPRKGKQTQTMRTRDVQSHIRKLENTLSRGTQFVGLARGVPAPRKTWQEHQKSQELLVAKRTTDLKPFANERLPGPPSATETISQRQEKIRTTHPTALNQVYTPPVIQPFNVKDLESLKKLTKANKKRMTAKWAKSEHKRAQAELKQMVAIFNNDDLNKKIAGLTYGQFDMIWNLTRFADAMSTGYHSIKAKYDSKQEVPESVIQDQINEANSILDWVKKFKI
jgi:hypothetical protein